MPVYCDEANDSRSYYPGRSNVDFSGRASRPSYLTREYAPDDSSDIDPTAFRRGGFSFSTRYGQQPRDYRHYASQNTYADRDSGFTHRAYDNFGSADRYASGGDRLSRDASRMRGSSGLDDYGSSSSFASGLRSSRSRHDSGDRMFGSLSRSRSGFDDLRGSTSSSARRHCDRSPPSKYFSPDDNGGGRSSSSHKYFSPDDIGRERSGSRYDYFGPDDIGRYSSSRSGRPSFGSGYGASGGYQTRIVTPGGDGGYGARSSRDRSRFVID